jgi:hypothetical protein
MAQHANLDDHLVGAIDVVRKALSEAGYTVSAPESTGASLQVVAVQQDGEPAVRVFAQRL